MVFATRDPLLQTNKSAITQTLIYDVEITDSFIPAFCFHHEPHSDFHPSQHYTKSRSNGAMSLRRTRPFRKVKMLVPPYNDTSTVVPSTILCATLPGNAVVRVHESKSSANGFKRLQHPRTNPASRELGHQSSNKDCQQRSRRKQMPLQQPVICLAKYKHKISSTSATSIFENEFKIKPVNRT